MKKVVILTIIAIIGFTWAGPQLIRDPQVAGKSSLPPKFSNRPSLTAPMHPLYFEENKGQFDDEVQFLARGPGWNLFLTADEAVFSVSGKRGSTENSASNFRLSWPGASQDVVLKGQDKLRHTTNYFRGGSDETRITNVAAFKEVRYKELYPGIDLRFYTSQNNEVEFDFIVSGAADPGLISMEFQGTDPLTLDDEGNLRLKFGLEEKLQRTPGVYVDREGTQEEIETRYVLLDTHTVGFDIGSYDQTAMLVIDPVISFSTYLSGGDVGNYSEAYDVAVDVNGNSYVTGETQEANFPTKNAIQPSKGVVPPWFDAFLSKFDKDGNLVFSTFLGGSDDQRGYGVAVDGNGDAYVVGDTKSPDFPLSNPLDGTLGGVMDAFVCKISSTGDTLIYSTYLGGPGPGGWEFGRAIEVDSSGNVYVGGSTPDPAFPVLNAAQPISGGGFDVFVTKIDPTGTSIVYSTFLGGFDADELSKLAVNNLGEVYVVGTTDSPDFPTQSPIYGAYSGNTDGFVTKLSADGSSIVFSTYLGGSKTDITKDVALDSSENVYVAGYTYSLDFPIMNAYQPSFAGPISVPGTDGFVTKINSAGDTVIYSTYLGGSEWDWINGLQVDGAERAHVAGGTGSSDFPVVSQMPGLDGSGTFNDCFFSSFSPSGAVLDFSTLIGGEWHDDANALALDNSGCVYLVGETESADFPLVNAFQTSLGSVWGAFVTKICPDPPPSSELGDPADPLTSPDGSTTWVVSSSGVMPVLPDSGDTVDICVSLATTAQVQLEVYTYLGERVKSLIDVAAPVGVTCWTWDGTNDVGDVVASGTYLVPVLIDGSLEAILQIVIAR